MKNAKVLESANASLILPNEISSEKFTIELTKLLKDQKKREELAANMAKLARPEAAKDLADVVLAEARG